MWDKVIDLLKQSVLIQGLVTIVLLVVISYLVISGHQVPEILTNAFLLVLGFYFGSKSQQGVNYTLDKMTQYQRDKIA